VSDFSLPYLEREPREASSIRPLLILLHGRAAEAKTIFSIEGLLDPRFHILSIQAPYPSNIGGFEWFPMKGYKEGEEFENENTIENSEQLLEGDIQKHLIRLNADGWPLFLWGFSQGAAMSLIIGLRGKIRPIGVIPMSGPLPEPVTHWLNISDVSQYLVMHGTEDEVLPLSTANKIVHFLQSHNIKTEYYEYRGRHKMTMDSIGHGNNWVKGLAGL